MCIRRDPMLSSSVLFCPIRVALSSDSSQTRFPCRPHAASRDMHLPSISKQNTKYGRPQRPIKSIFSTTQYPLQPTKTQHAVVISSASAPHLASCISKLIVCDGQLVAPIGCRS
ncbi:hypothetical protein BDZ45DRAFT_21796 [Acephala macrosclerotiorum]|nr:hypothetical protein BDZ45DRAFT_21796 [Acephala macrosclerotiorum]